MILLLLIGNAAYGQVRYQGLYDYLNLSPSARISGLGGVNITSSGRDSLFSADVSMFPANPALAKLSGTRKFGLSYQPYYAGVDHMNVAYTHKFQETGMWGAGIQYLNYGNIRGYDPAGNKTGEFSSNAYAVTLNHARQSGNFYFGVNLKTIGTQIAGYKNWGIAADIGGTFKHPGKDLTVGLVLKNFGWTNESFLPATETQLPADLQAGVSFKPRYMPFRFSFTGYRLLYLGGEDFNFDNLRDGGTNNKITQTVDKIFRHITFGGEILLSEHVNVLVGYNHLIASALKLENAGGGAGFSAAIQFRQKYFSMGLSRAYYHVSGGISHLTINGNLNKILR